MAEMPVLVRVAETFKKQKNVSILGVSLDAAAYEEKDAFERSKEVLEDREVTYQNFLWSGETDPLTDKLQFEFLPYTALVSGSGELLVKFENVPEDEAEALKVFSNGISTALAKAKTKKPDATKKDSEKKKKESGKASK